ncbi:unnamed protein product [Polarella glacialis]|uniref:Uncharacterized protein n=1 Tax=Polarella glacialis TaxID=89957 RepID=A0A813FKG2_POLGL|nr:unnamed protein product [Polarella glacialis]
MERQRILKGEVELPGLDMLPVSETYSARHLLLGMLQTEPASRPKMSEVIGHCFFWEEKALMENLRAIHRLEPEKLRCQLQLVAAPSASEVDSLEAEALKQLAGWRNPFKGQALLARMDSYAAASPYEASFAGLIRFLRNLVEHPPTTTEAAGLRSLEGGIERGLPFFLRRVYPTLPVAVLAVMRRQASN